jgi:hypothetical protein
MQPKLPARAGVIDTVARVQDRPESPTRARTLARLAVAAALILPFGGAVAMADTVDGTTPTTPTTPVLADPGSPTTPTTPTTPVATTPVISGAATAADILWTPPASITEETKFTLSGSGTVNGQATAHIAVVDPGAACAASPLYPMQTASGSRVTVAAAPLPDPALPAPTPKYLGGTTSFNLTFTPKESGQYRLCGWLVGTPAANATSTVAQFDQVVNVNNRPASLSAEIPDSARSGDYFSVKYTGTTAASGRRLLIMAETDKGQSCANLRKAASGKRPLQTVVGLPTGSFTKTVKLRYRTKTAGSLLLCTQIVETVDRNPEAVASKTMVVSEGIKCVATQTALTQRSADLGVVRKRRDSALSRLTAAKKKLAPIKARVATARKASNRRIATAQKAVKRAKSAAGKKKARKHLAAVRRAEAKRMRTVEAPLRKANATVTVTQRAYNQYRTGAKLLTETITRTKKDLKKYCANP